MRHEVVTHLNCRPGKVIVDGTVGGAGHSQAICEKISPGGFLIGLDQDPEAILQAQKTLQPFEGNFSLFHRNFIQLPDVLSELAIYTVDGVLLDLGLSYYHLKKSGRGFSFDLDEPLDMRMNPENGETAETLLNSLNQKDLAHLFRAYGEERFAKGISSEILKFRKTQPLKTTLQLTRIILRVVPRNTDRQRIHPATRVFMALRIAVNKELERLERFLQQVSGYLNPGGRLCILTYHSLEDRIVKHGIRELEHPCSCPPELPKCICHKQPVLHALTRKPLRPSAEEVKKNPMARSAKLRVAEKL
jgi:16S rRNA (cytosine1402-N4)-methyltransferase